MNAVGQSEISPEEAERQIKDLLASVNLPSSVSAVRFELGTDHIGDPAVRIFLVMDPEFQEQFDLEKIGAKNCASFARIWHRRS